MFFIKTKAYSKFGTYESHRSICSISSFTVALLGAVYFQGFEEFILLLFDVRWRTTVSSILEKDGGWRQHDVWKAIFISCFEIISTIFCEIGPKYVIFATFESPISVFYVENIYLGISSFVFLFLSKYKNKNSHCSISWDIWTSINAVTNFLQTESDQSFSHNETLKKISGNKDSSVTGPFANL